MPVEQLLLYREGLAWETPLVLLLLPRKEFVLLTLRSFLLALVLCPFLLAFTAESSPARDAGQRGESMSVAGSESSSWASEHRRGLHVSKKRGEHGRDDDEYDYDNDHDYDYGNDYDDEHDDPGDDDDPGEQEDDDKEEPKEHRYRLPKAKLKIKNLSRDRNSLNWIRLDASRSGGRRSHIQAYQFEITDLLRGEPVHSPGGSTRSIAYVLLSPGRYEVALKVTDGRGKSKTKTRTFKVRGKPQPSFDAARVGWAFGKRWHPGDPFITIATPGGPMDYSDIADLFSTSAQSGTTRSTLTSGARTSDSTTSGCGSIVTSVSNDYKIAGGAMSFMPGAGPLFGITGQVLGMYGAKQASACVQAQIAEINQQLAYQENQIQQIDDFLALGEFAFFTEYVQANEQNTLQAATDYYTQEQTMSDGCAGNYVTFMIDASMWDQKHCDAVPGVDVQSLAQETPRYICVGGTEDNELCTPGTSTDCGNEPGLCNPDPSFTSPFDKLKNLSDSPPPFSTVTDLAGTDPTAVTMNCGEAAQDCWKFVAPPPTTAESTLLNLYDALWAEAVSQVQEQMNEPQQGEAGNIVSGVYEAYNQTLASFYQRSLNVLNQAFFMEYLINQFNYYHAHGSDGTRNGNYRQGQSISSWGGVPGTIYNYDTSAFISAEVDAENYNNAQKQLALLYAARVNQLYLNTLKWVITDQPVAPQSYPVAPPATAYPEPFTGRLQVAIPFEVTVGTSLAHSTAGYTSATAWDTPVEQAEILAGQPSSNGSTPWTSNSILYQFSMQNPYKCNASLAKYNEAQETLNSAGYLADAFSEPADCPPIFALPDGAPLNQGFYDGETLQPYSYSISVGGTVDCTEECNSCSAGTNYTCGGVSSASACVPTNIGACASESPPTSCLAVSDGGLGLAVNIPETWKVGSNGSWSESCVTTSAEISGVANSLSNPPRLCATCPRDSTCISGPHIGETCLPSDPSSCGSEPSLCGGQHRSCETCPSGTWEYNDGMLECGDPTYECRGFCSTSNECGDYRFADDGAKRCTQCGGGPVLALSAPITSNVSQCTIPTDLTYFEVPYSYLGNNAGLIPGTTVLSCGNWKTPEVFTDTSPSVPVSQYNSAVASIWEAPVLGICEHGSCSWDCGTGYVTFQPTIPCETDSSNLLWDTPSAPECTTVGFNQVGVNTNHSAVLNFSLDPPNIATDSTDGGNEIALSLVFQCSSCQAQAQNDFGGDEPINNYMYGCTNLIGGPPGASASTPSDLATQIATDGYACQATTQINDNRETTQTLKCSSVDGREYMMGLQYSDSSTESGLSSGVSFISKQVNLGCPAACYQCDPGTGANGDTPGGQALVTGTDERLVCDGYCSGWNDCGDSNYNLANGTIPPTDCTNCGTGAFTSEGAMLCAASDFDVCACDGTVYYGKKFVNSLDQNGGSQPGGGTDLSGYITTFAEMISEPTFATTTSAGLIQCAPSSFENVDPAEDFYKHCYCSN